MERLSPLGVDRYVVLVLVQWFVYSVIAVDNDNFSYEYIGTASLLRLLCNGDCSADSKLVNIILFNSKMKEMAVYNHGINPKVFRQSVQDFSYYVALPFFGEDPLCHLEVVITNFKTESPTQFRCNASSSGVRGEIITTSTLLTIDKGVLSPQKQAGQSLTTNTLIILIVAIVILFLLTVFFLSIWLRGWRRYRNKMIYQSQSEISRSQVFCGDTSSVYNFQKSPSKLSVRKESDFKFPVPSNSVRRMTSRSETNINAPKMGAPPLPAEPPPKQFRRDRTALGHSMSACSAVKVPISYAQPQDAIETEFSEDGDVTSGNNEHQECNSKTFGSRNITQKTSFYSSALVKSVDV